MCKALAAARQIEHAAGNERPAVVDRDRHAGAIARRDAHPRAERQGAVCAGEFVGIVALAAGGAAAVAGAIDRGETDEGLALLRTGVTGQAHDKQQPRAR